jgi:hypothetical protein
MSITSVSVKMCYGRRSADQRNCDNILFPVPGLIACPNSMSISFSGSGEENMTVKGQSIVDYGYSCHLPHEWDSLGNRHET